MNVRIAPNFQITIPREIREEFALRPGEELLADILDDTIRLQRPRSVKKVRGIAKGMKRKDEDRDHTERF